MNYPFKFRFWDRNQKIFRECPDMTIEQLEKLSFDTYLYAIQYTGMKDKNDVEIYDQDILKFPPPWDGAKLYYRKIFWGGINRELGWKEAIKGDGHIHPIESHRDADGDFYSRYCEVVSNIFEHPELLEQ